MIKNLGEMYDDLWGQKILNAKIILFYVVASTDKMTRIEGPAGEQSLPHPAWDDGSAGNSTWLRNLFPQLIIYFLCFNFFSFSYIDILNIYFEYYVFFFKNEIK